MEVLGRAFAIDTTQVGFRITDRAGQYHGYSLVQLIPPAHSPSKEDI